MSCWGCRSRRGVRGRWAGAGFSSALRWMREASDGSPPPWFMARGATSLFRRLAERGQLAVDLGPVERFGFFGVVFRPGLDRGVAFVRHPDRAVLAPVALHFLLHRDLGLP